MSTCCGVRHVWGRRDLEPENGMLEKRWGKRNQEKETGRSQRKEAGGKEPAVAPGTGTRECNRYADTIMGVSTTVGSACGIICIQQI